MRDIKIVAYLQDVSEEDERLIETYLEGKGAIENGVTTYTVDPQNDRINALSREVADLKAELVEEKKREPTDG